MFSLCLSSILNAHEETAKHIISQPENFESIHKLMVLSKYLYNEFLPIKSEETFIVKVLIVHNMVNTLLTMNAKYRVREVTTTQKLIEVAEELVSTLYLSEHTVDDSSLIYTYSPIEGTVPLPYRILRSETVTLLNKLYSML